MPDTNNLKEGKIYFTQSFRSVQSIMVRLGEGSDRVTHIMADWKKREIKRDREREGRWRGEREKVRKRSFLVNSLCKCPHRHIQRYAFLIF
jgi:hypothetical protein